MILSKTKLYFILFIIIAILSFLVYNGCQSRAERDIALKEKQEERVLKEAEELEVKRVRDSATTAKRKTMERFERSFDSLDSINRNIKPIYHVKLKYIDRDVDDAIRILSSTKYEQ